MSVIEIKRELGVTHTMFFRSLAQLPDGWVTEVWADGATLAYKRGTIDIELEAQCERRIALMRIPYTPANFQYKGLTGVEQEEFQARFDLTFQRGGG
ncbi:MAG: hypothetical protein HOG18_09910 [Proteobacteria bacterium]|nr:hypothetical protein [Pseudomonadota bacterium]MBT4107400.1 hypothetical protein [Pseudomonadota bacterium]MBT4356154.1 hypothetical protein [Pseudomonadota bacterium]MBT4987397.1 hypothetical protein [Pseudomonadota bacterium]MBT5190559.1 hypothetical protein [Pseudomonadota bacterium]